MPEYDLTEAVEAATTAVRDTQGRAPYVDVAEAAITAALPHIERQVGEQVAQKLLAVDPIEWALAGQSAGSDAARIARGNS